MSLLLTYFHSLWSTNWFGRRRLDEASLWWSELSLSCPIRSIINYKFLLLFLCAFITNFMLPIPIPMPIAIANFASFVVRILSHTHIFFLFFALHLCQWPKWRQQTLLEWQKAEPSCWLAGEKKSEQIGPVDNIKYKRKSHFPSAISRFSGQKHFSLLFFVQCSNTNNNGNEKGTQAHINTTMLFYILLLLFFACIFPSNPTANKQIFLCTYLPLLFRPTLCEKK